MARKFVIRGSTTPGESVGRHVDYMPRNLAQQVIRNYNAPFYDVAAWPLPASGTVAITTSRMFSNGLGAGVTSPVFQTGNKTLTDTNLQTSGGIFPQGQAFKAVSFGAQVFPLLITGNTTQTTAYAQYANDYQMLCMGAYMTVGGGTTTIPFGLVAHWPAGFGATGVASAMSTANGVTQHGAAMSNGNPQAVARNYFRQPITFNATQAFIVEAKNEQAIPQILTIRSGIQVAWWGTWTDVLGG